MLLIPCPYCGPRNETEFGYGGQADVAYPVDPSTMDDQAWGEFLFVRANPRGSFTERWVHAAGCRRWFVVVRNTATNEITTTHPIQARRDSEQDSVDSEPIATRRTP